MLQKVLVVGCVFLKARSYLRICVVNYTDYLIIDDQIAGLASVVINVLFYVKAERFLHVPL
jgi:hypothetical protein